MFIYVLFRAEKINLELIEICERKLPEYKNENDFQISLDKPDIQHKITIFPSFSF